MTRTRMGISVPVIAGLLLATAYCSPAGSVGDEGAPPGIDAGPELDASPPPLPDGGEDAGCFKCSADLREVRGCDGALVATCGEDEGCDPVKGACVPACDAAMVNHSTTGCEYYATQPDGTFQDSIKRCFVAFVANTWTTPVTLSAEYNGLGIDIERFGFIPTGSGMTMTFEPLTGGVLPPGKIGMLVLSGIGQTCPNGITPAVSRPNVAGTEVGHAFHISADRPVTAFDMYPWAGGIQGLGGASLLLPTSTWGTNYMGVDAFERPTFMEAMIDKVPSTLQIVAQADNTNVTVVPTFDVQDGLVMPGIPKNAAATFTLHAGEVLQLASKSVNGTVVQSNKPVGVWATSGLIAIDPDDGFGDADHEQLPPIRAIGHEYVAVRYRHRNPEIPDEAPPWRLLGLRDGTILTYDPAPPAGAPTKLAAGELVKFYAPGPFTVRSQDDEHPFYMSAHMTGCEAVQGDAGPAFCEGDPEFVNVVPSAQFLSSYTFFTDGYYPNTNLVIVRPKAEDGTFKEVTLDCAGTIAGWEPVGTEGKYEYARVDLVSGWLPQGSCDNGVHTMKSDAPFGLTVWGWGSAASYAYPAGMRSRIVNDVVIPAVPK